MIEAQYRHTQRAPLYLLVSVPGLVMLVAGIASFRTQPPVAITLLISGGVMAVLACCFKTLTVTGTHDYLEVRFGPFPLFRKTIPYAHIVVVEQATSWLIDGWGVHRIPGRGWTWNLWGFDCVELRLKNASRLRIGSDDAAALTSFLQSKVETS